MLHQGDFPWDPGQPVHPVSAAPGAPQRSSQSTAHALPHTLLPASRYGSVPGSLGCIFNVQTASMPSQCQRPGGEAAAAAAEEEEIC